MKKLAAVTLLLLGLLGSGQTSQAGEITFLAGSENKHFGRSVSASVDGWHTSKAALFFHNATERVSVGAAFVEGRNCLEKELSIQAAAGKVRLFQFGRTSGFVGALAGWVRSESVYNGVVLAPFGELQVGLTDRLFLDLVGTALPPTKSTPTTLSGFVGLGVRF